MRCNIKVHLSLATVALLYLSSDAKAATDSCAYVPGFTLVDASTRRDIGKLRSTIRLQDYPANTTFNIRVNVNDTACEQRIQSVLINYNESTNDGLVFQRTFCEEYLPYTVFGDYNPSSTDVSNYARARYFRHLFPNVSATAWLQAVPYFGAGCQGRVHGQGRKRRFVVENAVFKAFESTEELYDAVDAWLAGDNVSDSMLAATYGYPIGAWDVSRIADFSFVFSSTFWCPSLQFEGCGVRGRSQYAAVFNDDISMWDVSNAKNMSYMFFHASSFNQDLSNWDVSRVTDFSYMFKYAESFGGDLSAWDVSSARKMPGMLSNVGDFNCDLSAWDVSRVNDMSSMFAGTDSFNGNISSWNVSKVRSMGFMFHETYSFNGTISSWDVSNVADMSYMFGSLSHFNDDISTWNVSSVTSMREMFAYAAVFNRDLSAWNVSSVKYMEGMFRNTKAFNGDLSQWDVSQVTNMESMFAGTDLFNCDISAWNVSSVTSIAYMFTAAHAFDQNLCEWGDRLSADVLTNRVFDSSACPNTSAPDYSNSPPGPFCHTCI